MYRYLMLNRKSIEDTIQTEGIGIHTGKTVKVRFLPAEPGTGIMFINNRDGMNSPIEASVNNVVSTRFAVTLGNGSWSVQTVEHLLAAFYVLGITDIIVELKGEEIPIFDGSCVPILNLFEEKRLYTYEESIEPIRVLNPIWMIEDDKFIIALPSEIPRISYTISYDHPRLKSQYAHFLLTRDSFFKDIAPSRTFGFERDVEYLLKNSLAQGVCLDNTVVLSDTDYINELRFDDECVRHKILDFIGDIALFGRQIVAYFIVCKSGHSFNYSFVKKMQSIYADLDIGTRIDLVGKTRKKS